MTEARASAERPGAPAPAGGRMLGLMGVVIAAAGLAVCWNGMNGAFVFDDVPQIVERAGRLSGPLLGVLAGDRRPVVTATLALNHALGGLDPRGYHAFNVAVHVAAALVLFGLVRRAAARFVRERDAAFVAFATALLWAVHPLQTESVTYVIQRAESMAALCMLLVLYAVLRAAESSRPAGWSALAVLACAIGMGCKATMVVAPVLALLFDALVCAPSLRAAWRARWGLHVAMASTWLLLLPTGVLGAALGLTDRPQTAVGLGIATIGPVEYLASQPGVILGYLHRAAWPDHLCIDHRWPVARSAASIAFPAVVVGLMVLATVAAALRRHPLAFCGVLFFLWLAPTSSVVPLRDLAVEHRMYLPLAAILVAVVAAAWAGLRRLPAAAPIGAAILAIAAAGLGSRTVERNRDYATPVALWSATVDAAPANRRARMNLGTALRAEGRLDEAIDVLTAVVEEAPSDALARLALGAALDDAGRLEEAIPHLVVASGGLPHGADAALLLGDALRRAGRPEEAVLAYRRADRIAPRAGTALALGNALTEADRPDEAAEAFEAAAHRARLAGRRDVEASALFNLGNVRYRSGAFDDAAAAYRRALEVAPDHDGARRWLAEAEARSGGP